MGQRFIQRDKRYGLALEDRRGICRRLTDDRFFGLLQGIHGDSELTIASVYSRGVPYGAAITAVLGSETRLPIHADTIYERVEGGKKSVYGFSTAEFDERFVYVVDETFDPELAYCIASRAKRFQDDKKINNHGVRLVVAISQIVIGMADVFRECYMHGERNGYPKMKVRDMGLSVSEFVERSADVLENGVCIVDADRFVDDAHAVGLAVAGKEAGRDILYCRLGTAKDIEDRRQILEGRKIVVVGNLDPSVLDGLVNRTGDLRIRDIIKKPTE